MSLQAVGKKVVRSVLFHAPSLYDLLTSDLRYRAAHRFGFVHEPDFRALPGLLSGPSPLIVDVGANLGQTVLSVKQVIHAARIVSFEPSPTPLAVLRRMQGRFPDLVVHSVALSDRPGTATLYTPVYMGKVMSGLASLDRHSAETWLNARSVFGFRPDRISLRTDEVPVMTLDDFSLSPALIKIDVQGAEERVIAGAYKTISEHRPVLLVESPTTRLCSMLECIGYRAWEYNRQAGMVPSGGHATNQFFL